MYYNITSGEKSEKLPGKIEIGGKVIASPSLKEAALVGWREMPETPKAEAGSVIVDIAFVQDPKDPLKVEAIVTKKSDAQVAEETAAMESAIQEANDKAAADRQKLRDEITAPFEKEQAEAIGKIFDLLRGVP